MIDVGYGDLYVFTNCELRATQVRANASGAHPSQCIS